MLCPRCCSRCGIPRALQALTATKNTACVIALISSACAVYSTIEHCLAQQEKKIEECLSAELKIEKGNKKPYLSAY